jgi:hypothetical protein
VIPGGVSRRVLRRAAKSSGRAVPVGQSPTSTKTMVPLHERRPAGETVPRDLRIAFPQLLQRGMTAAHDADVLSFEPG